MSANFHGLLTISALPLCRILAKLLFPTLSLFCLAEAVSVQFSSVQFSSLAQSCLTLCNPMNCSMPGFPVHHQHLKLAQSHVHQVGDAIQPSHPLSSPSPSSLNLHSIRIFSNESALRIRWPKYWNFSFNISPSNEHPGLISFRMTGWISLLSKGLSRVFSNTTVQKHQFFGAQLSSQSNSHIHT